MSTEYERKQELRLRKAGIRKFDKLIHDQDRAWLVENFGEGAPKYPVNVAKMIRNIIWQTRERVVSGDREKLTELIRTFWYMYVKPTLSRGLAGSGLQYTVYV